MKTRLATISLLLTLLFAATGLAALAPDTGQTKCYNDEDEIPCPSPGQDYYGQDANYTINPMSYTKLDSSGNTLSDSAISWAMVKDNVTGLIWEVKTGKDGVTNYSDPHDADNTYTWYDSNPATNGGNAGTSGNGTDTEDFIKQLNDFHFGGYSDWRLPTIKELSYILNDGIPYPGPTINTGYFPNTQASFYWSSTTHDSYTYPWGVGFDFGYTSYLSASEYHSFNVRAVRGGQAAPSYTDNKDGTVTDTSTELMWQQETPDNTMTWKQALAYCEGLSLGGHTDWRLPTKKELRSLVDYSRYNPAINTTYFPDTQASYYWSSTTQAYFYWDAWVVSFKDGGDSQNTKYSRSYVRAVRGGDGQSGQTDDCTSTIDSNLGLHIPYATYIHPSLGSLYFYTDMVCEPDMYDIIFKLTTLEVYTETPPYSCTSATLSSGYDLHVPDVLLPDGITHVWLDLRLDTTRSTEYIYFVVTNYGEVEN